MFFFYVVIYTTQIKLGKRIMRLILATLAAAQVAFGSVEHPDYEFGKDRKLVGVDGEVDTGGKVVVPYLDTTPNGYVNINTKFQGHDDPKTQHLVKYKDIGTNLPSLEQSVHYCADQCTNNRFRAFYQDSGECYSFSVTVGSNNGGYTCSFINGEAEHALPFYNRIGWQYCACFEASCGENFNEHDRINFPNCALPNETNRLTGKKGTGPCGPKNPPCAEISSLSNGFVKISSLPGAPVANTGNGQVDSNDDCVPTCTTHTCASHCRGDNCGKGCAGKSCARACTGTACGSSCNGANCADFCVGDFCGHGCSTLTTCDAAFAAAENASVQNMEERGYIQHSNECANWCIGQQCGQSSGSGSPATVCLGVDCSSDPIATKLLRYQYKSPEWFMTVYTLALLGKYPPTLINYYISDFRTTIQAEANTSAYEKLNYLETERGVMWYCNLFYTKDSCNAKDGGILSTAALFGFKWGDKRPVPNTLPVPAIGGNPSPPVPNTKPVADLFPMTMNRPSKSNASNHIDNPTHSSSDSWSDLEIVGIVFAPVGVIAVVVCIYKFVQTHGPAWRPMSLWHTRPPLGHSML